MNDRKVKEEKIQKIFLGETTIIDTEQSNLIDEQLNVKKKSLTVFLLLKNKYQKDGLYFAGIFDFVPYKNSATRLLLVYDRNILYLMDSLFLDLL